VAERNILGVIHKVGLEIGGKVIQMRKYGHSVVEIIGGRKVHPCTSIPGGLTKGINEEQRKEIEQMGRWAIEFAQFSLKAFNDIVLSNKTYLDLIVGDIYTHKTYYMGLVDENNKVNFYDGKVRVVGPDGKEYVKYEPKDYAAHIAEHVEPWTYLKFPYLKNVGWKGFVDGPESGVYMATPLSRLNAADGMATPLAQAEYEKFYSTLGGKPVHQRLAIHWARLIELLYAAERWVELVTDPEITSPNFHAIPTATPTEGVGIVEAPRGTLTHHYWTDERGVVTKVNLIVGTTNNYAPITMSIKKAADNLIKNGNVNEGLLNMVEMAFRAYDPCFGCATHSLPGQMPLEVTVHDAEGNPINVIKQFCK
jgi:F420-non-reducing hydrogenase large subunit